MFYVVLILILALFTCQAAEKPSAPKPYTVRKLKVEEAIPYKGIFYKINNRLIWDSRTDASRIADNYVLRDAIPAAIKNGEKIVKHMQLYGQPIEKTFTTYYYPNAQDVLCEFRDYGDGYFVAMKTAHEQLPAHIKQAFKDMPKNGQLLCDVGEGKWAGSFTRLLDMFNHLKSSLMIVSFDHQHVLKNGLEAHIILDRRWNQPLRAGDDYMLTVVAPKAETGKITFGPHDEWVKYKKKYRSRKEPAHERTCRVVRDPYWVTISAKSAGKAIPRVLDLAEQDYSTLDRKGQERHSATAYTKDVIDGCAQFTATLKVTSEFYDWFNNDKAKYK